MNTLSSRATWQQKGVSSASCLQGTPEVDPTVGAYILKAVALTLC